MAPNKSFRTYSRGNNSTISCVDAFNILFVKNLTQRKLHGKAKGKTKPKVEIKELPTKIKTVLNDESFLRVNLNDTFDRVLKGPCKKEQSNSNSELIRSKSSFSVMKSFNSISKVSPMVRKLRSYSNKSITKNTLDSWFNQSTPSGERITNMLEIEGIEPNLEKPSTSKKTVGSKTNRSSPILLRSQTSDVSKPKIASVDASGVTKCSFDIKNFSNQVKINGKIESATFLTQNFSFNPIFTNSVREQILVHSSTPVAPRKRQNLIGQPISPISNQDEITSCIVESLEEIKSWNSSLPKFEPLNVRKKNNKSSNKSVSSQSAQSQNEHPQTLTFDLEDFELFFEQLKSKSITEDDFEKFHKKLTSSQIDNQGKLLKTISRQIDNQGKLLKTISLKEFETFYESNQNHISFCKDSFFDSCDKSINFITHRKHKLSLNPRLRQHNNLTNPFNLKNLIVALENNVMNFTKPKLKNGEKSEFALRNSVNKKQLTVRLTRLSLNKLKLMCNQKQSLNGKHSENNKFKACRKFSSNWTRTSNILPNNNIAVTISHLDNESNRERTTHSVVSNMSSKKTIHQRKSKTKPSRNCYSDVTRSVQVKIGKECDPKSEKENKIWLRNHSRKKSCPTIQNTSRYDREIYNSFSKRKSCIHYLTTSKMENLNTISTDEIIDGHQDEELLHQSGISESEVKHEKQYVAKILLTSESDTSIEVNESQKSSDNFDEYSPPDMSTLLPLKHRRVRSFMRSYCLETPKSKPQRNTQSEEIQRELRISKSDTNVTYFTQDISDSILIKSNQSPTTFETNPLRLTRSFTRRTTISKTSCLNDNSMKDLHSDSSQLKITRNNQSIKEILSYIQDSIDNDNAEKINQFEGSIFKIPVATNLKPKLPNLRAGKSWRRSLMQHKRESFINLTRNSCCGSTNSPLKLENTRASAKILPCDESKRLRRKTALQTYVYSGMTVNDSFTDAKSPLTKKLSLEKPLPIITARDMVLKYCGQAEPVPFYKLYPKSVLRDCKKIGEGVYGEVFLYSHGDKGITTVMKVIPIEGAQIINGEKQKKFHEILSEVAIVSQLSNLRNTAVNKTYAFCDVQKISCVKGKYPKTLIDLWYEYDKTKGSENDPPDIFENDQLYIVLDLGNGGQDLEAFVFSNASQAVAMFKQVACALAVGEEHLQFEHRDLHWGNILLRSVDKNKKVIFKHKGKIKEYVSQGVEITIIDFTLSRIAHDGVVIFNDLGQDPDLFLAEGDYQFDIYRLMKEKNNNDWKTYTPYTNILWLHYILRKSITALRYKNTKTRIHKKFIDLLKSYENAILSFNSVSEFVDEFL